MTKQDVVYIPISVKEEFPPTDIEIIALDNGPFDIREFTVQVNSAPFGWDKNINDWHWLKPKENVYVITPEELLELRKKWAEEAYRAGYDRAEKVGYTTFWNKPELPADRESYINSLNID